MCLVAVMDWNGMGPTRSRASFSRSVGRWNGHHLVPTDRIFGPDPEPGESPNWADDADSVSFLALPQPYPLSCRLLSLVSPLLRSTPSPSPLLWSAPPALVVSSTSEAQPPYPLGNSGCEKILKQGNSGAARRESRAATLDLGAIH